MRLFYQTVPGQQSPPNTVVSKTHFLPQEARSVMDGGGDGRGEGQGVEAGKALGKRILRVSPDEQEVASRRRTEERGGLSRLSSPAGAACSLFLLAVFVRGTDIKVIVELISKTFKVLSIQCSVRRHSFLNWTWKINIFTLLFMDRHFSSVLFGHVHRATRTRDGLFLSA